MKYILFQKSFIITKGSNVFIYCKGEKGQIKQSKKILLI